MWVWISPQSRSLSLVRPHFILSYFLDLLLEKFYLYQIHHLFISKNSIYPLESPFLQPSNPTPPFPPSEISPQTNIQKMATAEVEIPKQYTAAIYDEPGKISTKIEKLDMPEPGAGEVLIRLTHSGVCHSDLGVMENSVGLFFFFWFGFDFGVDLLGRRGGMSCYEVVVGLEVVGVCEGGRVWREGEGMEMKT